MKLLIFLILIFPLHLLSAQDDINKDYTQGMSYYKANDFQNSYKHFSKIYLDKLPDTQFNFYFGRSAYETGHYETALAAFERVEMQDDSNLRNKLEMARTYYMLKMYHDSENIYEEILANPNIPQNIRTNIEFALSQVSKVQQKSFTYATVMADFLYDSNVNYASIGGYNYTGGYLPTSQNEKSDTALQVYADLINIYDIGEKNGYAVKNSFSVYSKNYNDETDYNVLYFSYNPSLLYKETLYLAELVLGIDMMSLGDEKYLSTFSIIPRFEYSHSPTLRSIAQFKYQRKKFEKNAQHDLDADRLELSYGLQDILSPRSYTQANIVAINEDKIRGNRYDVNYDEYKANLTYVNQFTNDYSVNLYAQARSRKYKDSNPFFSSKRSDIGWFGSVGFTVKLMQTLRFKIKTSYEHVDSNQDIFTYQKYTATAGIVKTF